MMLDGLSNWLHIVAAQAFENNWVRVAKNLFAQVLSLSSVATAPVAPMDEISDSPRFVAFLPEIARSSGVLSPGNFSDFSGFAVICFGNILTI